MSDLSDLAAFLLARIAEVEAVALACDHWHGGRLWRMEGRLLIDKVSQPMCETFSDAEEAQSFGEHVLRHQPGRVLVECEAKRRIVEGHSPVDPCDAHDANFRSVPCDTMLLLALPDAGHPDFRESWRV